MKRRGFLGLLAGAFSAPFNLPLQGIGINLSIPKNLKQSHNIDIECELTKLMCMEIQREIDDEIISRMMKAYNKGSVVERYTQQI